MRGVSKRQLIFVASVGALATACTHVPELETGPEVSVSQIVERVKCELVQAMQPYLVRRTEYDWLQRWTAGVDLTLVVTNQSGVTPSVSFIDPMTQVVLKSIGSFSQNFTLGLGAGATTAATRNETISFALSLKEIEKELANHSCILPEGHNLNSGLGLSEWVASAFDPIEKGLLKKGNHKPPKGGGGGRVRGLAVSAESQVRRLAPELGNAIDKLGQEMGRITDPRKAPSSSDVSGAIGDIDYLNRALDDKFPKGPSRPDPVARYQRELLDIKAQLKTLAASSKEKLDPPIESISHQVQFVVALTGNISPNWTLVRFKGPTLNGSLASAARTRTHTLVIVLGDPGTEQAKSQRAALTFGTAVSRNLPTFIPNQ